MGWFVGVEIPVGLGMAGGRFAVKGRPKPPGGPIVLRGGIGRVPFRGIWRDGGGFGFSAQAGGEGVFRGVYFLLREKKGLPWCLDKKVSGWRLGSSMGKTMEKKSAVGGWQKGGREKKKQKKQIFGVGSHSLGKQNYFRARKKKKPWL